MQIMIEHKQQTGLGRLGVLILILLLTCGVYVGYHVFPFYYYYWEIQGLMESQADKAATFSDEEIRQNLMEKIKKLEIPLEEEDDLQINRFNGEIIIDMNYSEVLYLDLGEKTYTLHVFNFNPRVAKPLRGGELSR